MSTIIQIELAQKLNQIDAFNAGRLDAIEHAQEDNYRQSQRLVRYTALLSSACFPPTSSFAFNVYFPFFLF
jgi:hypothetical protein